jgi:hypothetical protein
MLVVMGLGLVIVLTATLRWLWGQRWRSANVGRRVCILITGALSAVLLVLLAGGLQILWHERPNQPATAADLQILEKADALLAAESFWNRKDDKICDDDDRSHKWSLYCAIEAACRDAAVSCEHTQVASQEVRFAIEEAVPGAGQFEEGRLSGFNNRPETRFEDVKRVLRLAREHVRARLENSDRAVIPRPQPGAPDPRS